MSYPEVRYAGDKGEVSARFRPAGAQPELRTGTGGTVHYLATGASTAGDFGMYRWDMSNRPSGPDPPFHRTIPESFFLWSGTVRLYDGHRGADPPPGDSLHVPPGGGAAFPTKARGPPPSPFPFPPA